jgi:2-amino-4-hydroxy-6-hydroxymethyldihydropteridine diphosphokinase
MLRSAVEALAARTPVLSTSAVYETAAVGPPPPAYLNAAALVRWSGAARELLEVALGIEQRLGRVRRERWGPRTIDLDVLWIEGEVVDEPGLVVPHPELLARPFALVPLLELVPDARDPRTGRPLPRLAATGMAKVFALP